MNSSKYIFCSFKKIKRKPFENSEFGWFKANYIDGQLTLLNCCFQERLVPKISDDVTCMLDIIWLDWNFIFSIERIQEN